MNSRQTFSLLIAVAILVLTVIGRTAYPDTKSLITIGGLASVAICIVVFFTGKSK